MTRLLLPENRSYDLDHLPDNNVDIYYGVLDCQDKNYIDYQFLPLVFLESFYSPSLVLNIGDEFTIEMPLDWTILVCDDQCTEIEAMPLTRINDRDFYTMVYNPLRNMMPYPMKIEIENVYAEVKWYFPKVRNGNVLVCPVEDGEEPKCALFVKEANKIPTPLDPAELF